MPKIQVIMCPAYRAPYVCWVQKSEEAMEKLVGGQISIMMLASNFRLVCNERTMDRHLPENNSLPVTGFRGDCFLCGVEEGQLSSLGEETKRRLLRSCLGRWNALWEEKHGN